MSIKVMSGAILSSIISLSFCNSCEQKLYSEIQECSKAIEEFKLQKTNMSIEDIENIFKEHSNPIVSIKDFQITNENEELINIKVVTLQDGTIINYLLVENDSE